MSRIVVCGHNYYHGYLDMVARGLAGNGHQVSCFKHDNISVRKLETPNPLKRWVKRRELNTLNRQLIHQCVREQAEVLLCINGEAIFAETLELLNKSMVTALWTIDAVKNIRIPVSHLQLFCKLIFFVPEDLKRYGGDACLPFGCDDTVYRPLGLDREYDLVFVGGPHIERLPMLERVATMASEYGLRFGVWGPSYFKRKRLGGASLQNVFPHLAQCVVKDCSLTPAQVNEVYNHSRMALNIHHVQCQGCLNPRTFEILGAGALELVDENEGLNGIFERGEDLIAYSSVEDLYAKLGDLVADDERCRRIALQGHKKVMAHHTSTKHCARLTNVLLG